jgi:hypothetical protein
MVTYIYFICPKLEPALTSYHIRLGNRAWPLWSATSERASSRQAETRTSKAGVNICQYMIIQIKPNLLPSQERRLPAIGKLAAISGLPCYHRRPQIHQSSI